MNKLAVSVFAVLALVSASAQAFVVGNSEKCTADSKAYKASVEFSALEEVSYDLTYAAGKIDAMKDEPMAFVVDVTAGTAVRAAQAGVDVVQDGAEAIYKIATFAADTPMCAGNADRLSDGVNCIIQLPNKTLTMALVTGSNMAEHIVVGVYSVGSGLLGAVEDLTSTIAEGLQKEGVVGEVLSAPFVIIGLVAKGLNVVAEVVLYDTVGGAFANLSEAFITVGTDVCDIFTSLTQLRLDQVLYHTLGLVADTLAEGANLVIHIITLGHVSLREEAKKPRDSSKDEGNSWDNPYIGGN